MNTTHTSTEPVRVAANYTVTKRLGNWTAADRFQVRSHRGHAVLDLRSPDIQAGEISVDIDLDHAMLKLLVPDDAVIEDWDLRRAGRGRVKDAEGGRATHYNASVQVLDEGPGTTCIVWLVDFLPKDIAPAIEAAMAAGAAAMKRTLDGDG